MMKLVGKNRSIFLSKLSFKDFNFFWDNRAFLRVYFANVDRTFSSKIRNWNFSSITMHPIDYCTCN